MTRERNAVLDRVKERLPSEPDAFEGLQRRRDVKARRKRVAAGTVGLGITIALVSLLLVWTSRTDTDGHDPAGGISAPRSWSTVPSVPGPGEYYYVRFRWEGNGTVQLWLAADGSGRRLWKGGAGPEEEMYSPQEGTSQWLVPDLPDDPDQFFQQMIERGGPNGRSPGPEATTSPGRSQEDTAVLHGMSDLLTFDGALMPGQVQALFGAAQQIEGVQTDMNAVDPWGRQAFTLSHVIDFGQGPAHELVWYFDPDTGQFLGEVWVNEESGRADAGTIVELSGIVDSDHEVPRAGDSFIPEPTEES
jgi:hypothetical protein